MSNFIITTDKNTRDVLKELGLNEVQKRYGEYVFINDPAVLAKFAGKKSLKISYSNKLNL